MDGTNTYSATEARAKLGKLLRRVRNGERIVISYRGSAVAEMRPPERTATTEERVRELEARGILRPALRPGRIEPLARVPGALDRFLASRA